jgi:hypothetical protein
LRKVDALEHERRRIASGISRPEADDQKAAEATSLNEAGVSKVLASLANEL